MDLKIPFRERMIVYSLFTGGLLASSAGAVRTYFTWVMTTAPDFDVTWNAYLVILTSVLELYIGIVRKTLNLHQWKRRKRKGANSPRKTRLSPPSPPPSLSSAASSRASSAACPGPT